MTHIEWCGPSRESATVFFCLAPSSCTVAGRHGSVTFSLFPVLTRFPNFLSNAVGPAFSWRLASTVKILIVDDFATMRRIIKNLLHTLGFDDVSEAEDGTVALPMLHNEDYEFLITDLNMPGMSGLDLLRAVRADSKLCRLPVLVVTADANREQIVAAAKAGVDGYMVKPFSAAVLKSKIEAILARSGQRRNPGASVDNDAAD